MRTWSVRGPYGVATPHVCGNAPGPPSRAWNLPAAASTARGRRAGRRPTRRRPICAQRGSRSRPTRQQMPASRGRRHSARPAVSGKSTVPGTHRHRAACTSPSRGQARRRSRGALPAVPSVPLTQRHHVSLPPAWSPQGAARHNGRDIVADYPALVAHQRRAFGGLPPDGRDDDRQPLAQLVEIYADEPSDAVPGDRPVGDAPADGLHRHAELVGGCRKIDEPPGGPGRSWTVTAPMALLLPGDALAPPLGQGVHQCPGACLTSRGRNAAMATAAHPAQTRAKQHHRVPDGSAEPPPGSP